MDEAEFNATAAAQAWDSFEIYFYRLLRLYTNYMTNSAIGNVITGALGKLANPQSLGEPVSAQDNDEPLLFSMCIVAAWGAFEAYIEDACKSAMAIDSTILDGKDLKGVSVKVADLLAPEHIKLDKVFRAIKNSVETRDVVDRFARTLSYVQLDITIPTAEGAQQIADSYRIRNVWAHNAGKADQLFVKETKHLGFSVGDEVSLPREQAIPYLAVLYVYAISVHNRLRNKYGLPEIKPDQEVFTGQVMPQFVGDLITVRDTLQSWKDKLQQASEHSAPDTTASESGDPPQ